VVQTTLDLWPDVLVPFGSALVGGAFALLGARWGARWAARYQDEGAGKIARRVRRDEREEEALLLLDEHLNRLEIQAEAMLMQADANPGQFASNFNSNLSEHLYAIHNGWSELRLRLYDVRVRLALAAFLPRDWAYELDAAAERRKQSNDATEAVEFTRNLLAEVQDLRTSIREALGGLA
jgi:hypothetical protein